MPSRVDERFCFTACVRFKLSCNTFTRSTTLVGVGAAAGLAVISLCCAFCSMISINAVRYSSRYFSGSQATAMLSMSACAIFSSLSLTAVLEPFCKTSALNISLAKCISSRIRNKPSGFTAARCSRLLITTLAIPILPVPLSALCKTCVSFLPAFLRLKEIRLVEKLRIDLLQINEIGNVDRMSGFDAHLLEVLILHHNITAALEFEALYDLVGWNFL